MTMSRIIECKFECKTKLGDFDQDAHKYREVDTGELHTQERCMAAKAKLASQTEISKQNEQKLKEIVPIAAATKTEYVDHTLAGIPRMITIVGENSEEMDDLANSWLRLNNNHIKFRGGTRVYNDAGFEVTLWYEEKS